MKAPVRTAIAATLVSATLPLGAQPQQPVATHHATIVTTLGTLEADLYGRDAPLAVTNFVGLAMEGFYDGLLFHRVFPDYLIQTGDPTTRDTAQRSRWGTAGESYFDTAFVDELDPATPSAARGYVAGTLAMANRRPNANTSQFFIMAADNAKLKVPVLPRYTIFGRVTEGLEVVEKISRQPLADMRAGLPEQPVRVLSLRVEPNDSTVALPEPRPRAAPAVRRR